MNTETIDNRRVTFGQWVREQREALKLTQGQAGRKAGLSRVQWTRIETGDSGTKRSTIPQIARALNRTTKAEIDEVYSRAGFAPDEQVHLPASMALFMDLSPGAQEDIARIVKRIYDGEQAQKAQEDIARIVQKAKS